ncbi:MAG TPA: SDR family NAD(P)-dependent oxidoreductase [Gemmatimonadaceae bacterium]|nr:SDR family NAD(P)-dependent oxidoreductase [Gemmatimonadaceae bacterium]
MTTRTLEIDLRGKRALVTGASRGIGAATVRALAAAGADVAVGYRNRVADADAVVAEAQLAGVRAVACAADVGNQTGAQRLIDTAASELGGLDIFVANAGIWPSDDVSVERMGEDRWRRTLRENLDSIFFTTRAAVRAISDGGQIVLVSSTAGQRGEAGHADYAASKGAVISFTKSLAVELGPRQINVNCVAPGWVDTEMVRDAIAGSGIADITASIPLRRIASPEDIALPIVFLCSRLARHITGEVLNINGGSVLCG